MRTCKFSDPADVGSAYSEVTLSLPPAATVRDAKQQALALTHTAGAADDFLVKSRGAELFDETRSLADHGVVPNAALIVLPRRRRPVR